MLSIGSVRILPEELLHISGFNHTFQMLVRWRATDLPVLLDLEERTTLRFDHLADDDAEMPAHLTRWEGRLRLADNSVVVRLTLTVGAEGQASSPVPKPSRI